MPHLHRMTSFRRGLFFGASCAKAGAAGAQMEKTFISHILNDLRTIIGFTYLFKNLTIKN